jgi:hypothetical protein
LTYPGQLRYNFFTIEIIVQNLRLEQALLLPEFTIFFIVRSESREPELSHQHSYQSAQQEVDAGDDLLSA